MSSEFETIIINTGNIFSYGIIGPSVIKDPKCEVFRALDCVCDGFSKNISNWQTISMENNSNNNDKRIELKCLQINEPSPSHIIDRDKLKISIKLFLFPEIFEESDDFKKSIVEESIFVIRKILNINQIDNLILSIQTNDIDLVLPNLKSFWKYFENFVLNQQIKSLSTSDLNCQQLMELYEWTSNVKPFSTQINLDECCDIPADLTAFSKEKSILLLTHNDPNDNFLPVDSLEKFLEEKNELLKDIINFKKSTLKRKWIARFTIVEPGRAVVSSKGYLLSLMGQNI